MDINITTQEQTLVSFDWALKGILRDQANFDLLAGFLSALLAEEIQVVTLLESDAGQERAANSNRLDLLVQDSRGASMIAVLQSSYSSRDLIRLPIEAAHLIMQHLEAGKRYGVRKVISIRLCHFALGADDENRDYVYHGVNQFHGQHDGAYPDREAAIFPEYYLIVPEQFPDEVKNVLDEWIYFFKHGAILAEFQANQLQTARQKLDLRQLSDAERRDHDLFVLTKAVEQTVKGP
jgi:hypothetical protein